MDITDIGSPAVIADGAVRSTRRGASDKPPWFRRRRYIVNSRYQMRLSLSVAALVLTLVVLLNICIVILGTTVIEGVVADSSAISTQVREQLRFSFGLLLIGSVVFVVGIFALRSGDDLEELATAFNGMSEAMQKRAQEDIEVLRSVAHEVEQIAPDPAGPALARRIRTLVDTKKAMLGRRAPD